MIQATPELEIEIGRPDSRGRALVVAKYGGELKHSDTFEIGNDFLRLEFGRRVSTKLPNGVLPNTYSGENNHHVLIADAVMQAAYAVKTEGDSTRVEFEWLTCAELADCNDETKYIVEDLVPAGQGGVIAGPPKCLKSTTGMDLTLSVATGTEFLDRFPTAKGRAGFMAAEAGGKGHLRHLASRVALKKGFDLRDIEGAFISTDVPQMGNLNAVDAVERFIVTSELDVLLIDPSYLAFAGVGESASNVFVMGRLLLPLTKIIERTGCAIVLVNHNKKSRDRDSKEFDPPKRSDISMSGFAEWMRWWLLFHPRRSWDDETGSHWLWMVAGGSAGHAGTYHLDAVEGCRSDPGGRVWQPTVTRATEGIKVEREQREKAKEAKQEADRLASEKRAVTKLLDTVAKLKCATKNDIRDRCGLSGKAFPIAWAAILLEKHVVEGEPVTKANNQLYPTFKLATPDTPDTPDKLAHTPDCPQ